MWAEEKLEVPTKGAPGAGDGGGAGEVGGVVEHGEDDGGRVRAEEVEKVRGRFRHLLLHPSQPPKSPLLLFSKSKP
jgi:hypothetical protein